MLTFTHGGRLQVLRNHEARDQQKPDHRGESAPIAPDHHVPILESASRLCNPAMAREPTRRQFGAMWNSLRPSRVSLLNTDAQDLLCG